MDVRPRPERALHSAIVAAIFCTGPSLIVQDGSPLALCFAVAHDKFNATMALSCVVGLAFLSRHPPIIIQQVFHMLLNVLIGKPSAHRGIMDFFSLSLRP